MALQVDRLPEGKEVSVKHKLLKECRIRVVFGFVSFPPVGLRNERI
jgi:hypothetical protein